MTTRPGNTCSTSVRADEREWTIEAVRLLESDGMRSADTHLHVLPLPADWGIDVYLKDESAHPTGSLKHRLARSLVLYGLVNGWIGPTTVLYEASSGSTAVSLAHFARLLGLRFVAVVPTTTSSAKIALIERYGGTCQLVENGAAIAHVARELASSRNGHFVDQFTYAERATDWRGNNNIAESIFEQMRSERYPTPAWIVVGAGTGGTSATIGRYVRFVQRTTRLMVVDPEHSAFLKGWEDDDPTHATGTASRIEGIGRPTVEPSFVPTVIDRMMRVPDAASVAGMRFVQARTGRHVGPSTGSNIWGVLMIVAEMIERGDTGSIVTLICDGGDRYIDTYADDDWARTQGWDSAPYLAAMSKLLDTGCWKPPE